MGREDNLVILLKYIERALEINAIDHYWMIDMTRCMADHNYIAAEQSRLDKLYPGRVHLHNSAERKKLIQKGEEAVKQTIGKWGTFYKFLERFGDNDIIAKCDDDTLFIDVETLEAAFDLRWKNKSPYIMHANCINNGVTAYHQRKKGIWRGPDTLNYPTCGLTGPLFSNPEIACYHHVSFCNALQKNIKNINKFKLGKNIYFCNRVSINFIFMLGSDRDTLSKIDEQDEYEVSSKIPQRLDRPNMIIGDFTVAHHTYGVQEPCMDIKGTYDHYKRLADTIFSDDNNFRDTIDINKEFNAVSTIKIQDKYLMNSWSTGDRVAIKNKRTGQYLALAHDSRERTIGPKKIPTGMHLTKSNLTCSDEPMLWYIQDNMIRTGAEILKTVPPSPSTGRFNTHLINIFYQGNYKKNKFVNIAPNNNTTKLESQTSRGIFLNQKVTPQGKSMLMMEKLPAKDADDWIFEKILPDTTVLATINRTTPHNIDNDHTFSTCNHLPTNDMTRGFYWMVTEYVWEFIHIKDNIYHIKVIADDKDDMYLFKSKDGHLKAGHPEEFEVNNNNIKHVDSNLYISVDDGMPVLSDTKTELRFNI